MHDTLGRKTRFWVLALLRNLQINSSFLIEKRKEHLLTLVDSLINMLEPGHRRNRINNFVWSRRLTFLRFFTGMVAAPWKWRNTFAQSLLKAARNSFLSLGISRDTFSIGYCQKFIWLGSHMGCLFFCDCFFRTVILLHKHVRFYTVNLWASKKCKGRQLIS